MRSTQLRDGLDERCLLVRRARNFPLRHEDFSFGERDRKREISDTLGVPLPPSGALWVALFPPRPVLLSPWRSNSARARTLRGLGLKFIRAPMGLFLLQGVYVPLQGVKAVTQVLQEYQHFGIRGFHSRARTVRIPLLRAKKRPRLLGIVGFL